MLGELTTAKLQAEALRLDHSDKSVFPRQKAKTNNFQKSEVPMKLSQGQKKGQMELEKYASSKSCIVRQVMLKYVCIYDKSNKKCILSHAWLFCYSPTL